MARKYLDEVPSGDNKPKGRQWKKVSYGNNKDTRQRVYDNFPTLVHVTDSIANRYGISPKSLRTRIANEGFIDEVARNLDDSIKLGDTLMSKDEYMKRVLLDNYDGYGYFGLDDVNTLINQGKVNLISENYSDVSGVNEHGRKVSAASGDTNYDNIGITAATLKYFKDEAKKAYPKATNDQLERYSNIMYNRGVAGGKKYINNGGKGYKLEYSLGGSFRPSLKHGGIYIQPSHRGRFTALKEKTGHSTSWFKENGTPAQKKMATFALNAAKWNH